MRVATALLCCGIAGPIGCTPNQGTEPVAESPAAAARLGALLGESADPGFARVLAPRAFEFPRDHAAHPEFAHEWWYVTGNLDGEHGRRFGFELSLFRISLAPEAAGSAKESKWRAHQIYLGHFAITDLANRSFEFAERRARAALGLAGAQAEPLRIWVEDWSLAMEPSGETWRLQAADGVLQLELELRATKPVVLNGENGLSRKSDAAGNASYYYSIPRLEARGRLVRGGESFSVQGQAWLDREWGTSALATEQQGWDWFALQLDDNTELMFYALRHADGSRDPHSAGTWIASDGSSRTLADSDVTIEVLDRWDSPHGGRYPARWRLQIPRLHVDLQIRPVLSDQELITTPRYWEGAVDVTGSATGRGYAELTGYARSP